MIGVAWLMSSHKSRVNWRLVLAGVGLQLVLAAVLFQSQNWTFARQISSGGELLRLVDEGRLNAPAVDLAIEQPAWGQVRVSNESKRPGLPISPAGVRCV